MWHRSLPRQDDQRNLLRFTDETRDLKHACRKMERAWRKSKLDIFYLAWCDSVLNYKRALNSARTAYFSGLINNNKHNPRFLFNTVAKLTQKPQSVSCAPFNANDFLDFFCNAIDEIRIKIRLTQHLWLPRQSLLKNIPLPILN